MTPQREIRVRPIIRNVEKQGLPNAPEVQPQEDGTNVKFKEAITMLSQAMGNQVGHQGVSQQEGADT